MQAAASFLRPWRLAAEGSKQRAELSAVEFLMSSFRPWRSAWMRRAIKSFAEFAQMLLGMKAIHDLNGPGEQLRNDIPDPGSSITERNHTRGLRKAAALGLAPDALRKGRTFLGDVQCGGT